MYKVKDLIKKLEKCDPDYIVKLGDWNEEYESANKAEAQRVIVYPEEKIVIIGSHAKYDKIKAIQIKED